MGKDEKEPLPLDFATLSSTHKARLRIYGSEISKPSRFSANEIIKQVAKDVAMMREADVVGTLREIRSNKPPSIPLTSFTTVMNNPEEKICEMQTFTDTEMLDAADGAEAVLQMMSNKGMTQLFDTSFNNKDNLFNEITDAAVASKTALMVASKTQDIETFDKVIVLASSKAVESKTDEVVGTKDIRVIEDYKPHRRIDDIELELNEEMATIGTNFRILREKNDRKVNFLTDRINVEIDKLNVVESGTPNNGNKNEYMKLNLSIEELVGFQEVPIIENRPPSPVLTPTIKFMKSGRGQNVKRKIYSLEAFEKVEASVNKKFRSQANFFKYGEFCSSSECFNKTSDCYILNDNIENDVLLSSDEEYYLSQTKSVISTMDNSFKSMNSLNIDKWMLTIPSQPSKRFEVLKKANENPVVPLDPPESEKPIDQALINKGGIYKFHERHENAKRKTENVIKPSQSIKFRKKLNIETEFENTSHEFDIVFDEKDKFPSVLKTGSSIVENICKKNSPDITNGPTDYETIEAMKSFLGFAPSNKNVHILNEKQTNFQKTVNKTLIEESDAIKFKAFACNNTTKVSVESLAKTKNLLRDIEDYAHMKNDFEENKEFKAPLPKFQGFITASNKNIKVSAELLAKTKTIFQDIEGVIMEDDYDRNKEFKTPLRKFQGFTTASNKNIKVSDESLAKTKTIFQDIEGLHTGDHFDVNKGFKAPLPTFQGFTTVSNKNIKVSDESLAKTKTIFQDIEGLHMEVDFDGYKEIKMPLSKFQGFTTASNKNIKVSDESLVKTKTIFQDIEGVNMEDDFDRNKEFKTPLRKFQGFTTASNKNIKVSAESLAKTKMIFQDIEGVNKEDSFDRNKEFEVPLPKFQGFTTAGNKNIKVSDESLAKTKTIFQDIEGLHTGDHFDGYKEIKMPLSKFQGFTTASNKNIKVSDESLAKTKMIFQDIEGVNMEDNFDRNKEFKTPLPTFRGFNTGSNKNIKVSDESLAKTKTIFQDIAGFHMEDDFNGNKKCKAPLPTFKDFATASNKNIKVSDESLVKTKTIFQDIEGVNMEDDFDRNKEFKTPLRKFQGFTTASNKNIKVSAESLAKTKMIFQDIEGVNKEDGFDRNKEFEVPLPKFQGFTTAGNKNIKVSDESLAKTKTIFQDIEGLHTGDHFDGYKEIKMPLSKFQGFTTASNKNIKVSDESLAKTKMIFQDIEGVNMEDNFDRNKEFKTPLPTFRGFNTGSNKNIKVSDESLAKTKTIFQDIAGFHMEDDFNGNKKCKAPLPTFKDFATASNKNIKVSAESLAKTKTIFQDIEGVNMEDDFDRNKEFKTQFPKFRGFTTASNKNIKVSDESLAKTKTIFQDIEGTSMVSDSKEVKVHTKLQPPIKFEGFSTASNKTIKVSEEALLYTKNIFEDCEKICNVNIATNFKEINSANINNIEIRNEVLPTREKRTFEGFSTGNNKKIKVSETALEETKMMFEDLNTTEEPELINNANTISNVNNDLLNTQIKSHFEETLYTEDFCETPKKVSPVRNTKSGSPILPYSTAKRRVFKAPYKIKTKIEGAKTEKAKKIETKPALEYKCDDKYKSNPEKTLKDLKISKSENFQHFDFNDTSNFRFSTNDLTDFELNVDAVKNIFLNSVDRKLVPEGWMDNHIKLILWKLQSYEVKFPRYMCGVASPKSLLQQLKYRYDRELYKVERPVLRKILERDETAGRCMVLCVVRIHIIGVENVSATNTTELEVTDGWYCVRATIDRALSKAIADGKLTSGTKIITHGAELLNCEQGVAPWENTSSIRLKLSGNSTRRVPWHTRLGLHAAAAVRVHLRTLTPEGGKVSAVRAYVARVYPLLFVEKFEDGSTVTRSERLEALEASRHESERHSRLEAVYQELERETATTESQEMLTAFRICKYGEQEDITASQLDRMNEESWRKRDEILEDLRRRVQEKIEESGLDKMERNVVPLLKIRICDWKDTKDPVDGKGSTNIALTKACLSVWKPSESLMDMIKEGVWIDAMNVVPTAVRMSELHISAGRQSIFHKLRNQNVEKFSRYVESIMRKCTRLSDVRQTEAPFNEVDLAGLVFEIEPDSDVFDKLDARNQNFQNVYISDGAKNFACVHFWGGLKKFGFDKVIERGQFVSCSNLQVRMGNSRKNIPQFRVTEFSVFTKVPRNSSLSCALVELKKEFEIVNIGSFCDECVTVKNNKRNIENESPYRFHANYNSAKNMESPSMQNLKNDLTGLDFESTFKLDSQLTAEALRKSRLKSKMEKLKMYGEPPPLSPMHIANTSSKVEKAYISPVLDKENVTSESESRREVNPVRLNFSCDDSVTVPEKHEGASEKDFSEEFEYSPPLSLDGEYL